MFKRSLLFLALICTPLLVWADWRESCGYLELKEYLQVTDLPTSTTDGVPLMIVEALDNNNYMPSSGLGTFTVSSGEFSNKTLTNVSNESASTSSHAIRVGRNYFSNSSFIAGINSIDVYTAEGFNESLFDLSNAEYQTINGIAYIVATSVPTFTGKISSFAWIGSEPDTTIQSLDLYSQFINRYDYVASTGNTLMVAGLNNGAGTTVPTLWGQTYNGVVVGRTNGGHSRGGTANTYDSYGIMGGRTKPDIVAPETATSYSTGQVASGAGYVYGLADSLGYSTITANTDLQKAVLLAGATKEEFSNWDNSALTQPLDNVYGAGEMNVFNTHRVIEGGQYTSGDLVYHGWDRVNVGGSGITYNFKIPAGGESAQVNIMLCWQRVITETKQSPNNPNSLVAYIPEDFSDLRIEVSGGNLSAPIVSDSSVDNVEHIHIPALEPGVYQLTLSNNSGGENAVDAALAWRMNFNATNSVQAVVSDTGIEFSNLIPGVRYEVWESPDLSSGFTFIEYFTPTSSTYSWSASASTGNRHFYRLKYWE